MVSGIGYGTFTLLKGFGLGISGLVTQPIEGARSGGVKGATIGMGKGIIGLVSKPVAGTFGFV